MADLNQKFNEINNTKDSTAEFDQQDIQSNKVMGILAYLSWLVLIPIFAAKGSKFARFHSNQGLVLAIVEAIIGVAIEILSNIPVIGWIFGILGFILSAICTVFTVLGIVNAARGKAKELPIIGGFKILK